MSLTDIEKADAREVDDLGLAFDILQSRFALPATGTDQGFLAQKPVVASRTRQLPLQYVRAPLADEVAELVLHGDGRAIRPEGLAPPELRAVPLTREQRV